MDEELAVKYHSISFINGDATKNTWLDYRLIPTSRPSVVPPSVKTTFVDVTGADGSLDLTSSLDSRVHYGMREGEWKFAVYHEAIDDYNWTTLCSQLLNDLHGKKFEVQLMDETTSNLYYFGRIYLDDLESDPAHSQITIKYVLEPYRYDSQEARASAT